MGAIDARGTSIGGSISGWIAARKPLLTAAHEVQNNTLSVLSQGILLHRGRT